MTLVCFVVVDELLLSVLADIASSKNPRKVQALPLSYRSMRHLISSGLSISAGTRHPPWLLSLSHAVILGKGYAVILGKG